MQEEQLEEIESKAEDMGISTTHVFSVIVEEGLENLSR
jgi:hypothetical protein